jgi:uncharacterized protein YacL
LPFWNNFFSIILDFKGVKMSLKKSYTLNKLISDEIIKQCKSKKEVKNQGNTINLLYIEGIIDGLTLAQDIVNKNALEED